MNFSRWDWHGPDGKNFVESRRNMPLLDAGVSALVDDLHVRGLIRRCVGRGLGRVRPHAAHQQQRRPRPLAASQLRLLAGGGMKTGQVIGATDRLGGLPRRPPGEVPGSLRHALQNIGLNLNEIRVFDPNGRPQYLVDQGNEVLPEVY